MRSISNEVRKIMRTAAWSTLSMQLEGDEESSLDHPIAHRNRLGKAPSGLPRRARAYYK